MWARIRDDMIWENRTVELLGITIGDQGSRLGIMS